MINTKYYFLSYFLEAAGYQTVCNAVTEKHPFIEMQDVQKKTTESVQGATFTTLISFQEVSEQEYLLFKDLPIKL